MQINSRALVTMQIAIHEPDFFKKLVLTKAQAGVMQWILRNGNRYVTSDDLAKTKGIKKNWASMQLRRLTDMGYLKRVKLKTGHKYRAESCLK